MPGYVYRGTNLDAHLPLLEPPRTRAYRNIKNPATCGTYGGYKKHVRRETEVCHPCRIAASTYKAQRTAAARAKKEKS